MQIGKNPIKLNSESLNNTGMEYNKQLLVQIRSAQIQSPRLFINAILYWTMMWE